MILVGRSGASTRARSVIRMLGIFGMKISPPCMLSSDEITKSTPCCRVIQNRVISASVIGSSVAPSRTSRSNSGTTLPREPTTLP